MSRYHRNRDFSELGCFGWCLLLLILVGLIWLEVQIACWLWGIIMVTIFGLPYLTGWQMFGLMVLMQFIMPTSYHTSK